MDTTEQAALTLLRADELFNADLLDVLHRGAADVIVADERGVLLRDRGSRAYMMTTTSPAAGAALVDLIPATPYMVTHQAYTLSLLADRLGLTMATECRQCVYLGRSLPVIDRPDLRVATLGVEWADTLCQQYSLGLGVEHMRERCAAGVMLGAFRGDTLVGFVGQHSEGSMGMLEVFPQYRRQGIGAFLLTCLGNQIIAEGRRPFDQIITGNIASEALQRGLGFTVSEDKLYWVSSRDPATITL